jgi:hypothetical protein
MKWLELNTIFGPTQLWLQIVVIILDREIETGSHQYKMSDTTLLMIFTDSNKVYIEGKTPKKNKHTYSVDTIKRPVLSNVLLQTICFLKSKMYCFYVLCTVSIKHTVAKKMLEKSNVLYV